MEVKHVVRNKLHRPMTMIRLNLYVEPALMCPVHRLAIPKLYIRSHNLLNNFNNRKMFYLNFYHKWMFICCRCVQSTAQTSWSTSVVIAALQPFSSASVLLISVMPVTTTFRELLTWQNQTCHTAQQVRLLLFLNASGREHLHLQWVLE